jgi:cation diffusion facilitator family transporter
LETNKARSMISEGYISIAINLLLFIAKYLVGIASGSVAIIADGWHSLSDTLSSVAIVVGARASAKPPDQRHPFGHGRAQAITALIVGVILAVVGVDFLIESIQKLIEQTPADYVPSTIWVLAGSIFIKEALAQYSFWVSRRVGRDMMRAEGWHHRSDALAAVVILAGVLFGGALWWLDGALGVCMVVVLWWAAYTIMKEAIGPLMGKKHGEDIEENIRDICIACTGRDVHLHHIHVHQYGEHSEVSFHMCFPGDMLLEKAHEVVDTIEERIRRQTGMEATIHMESMEQGIDNE